VTACPYSNDQLTRPILADNDSVRWTRNLMNEFGRFFLERIDP
jgi:hypothetical protein